MTLQAHLCERYLYEAYNPDIRIGATLPEALEIIRGIFVRRGLSEIDILGITAHVRHELGIAKYEQ